MAASKSEGRKLDPTSTQVYLSTRPRKKLRRFVPFSRMISARSTYFGIVDDDSATLAAGEVLGLVEALRGHDPEGAERPAPILPEEPVRVVLYHVGIAVSCRDTSRIRSISQPTPA